MLIVAALGGNALLRRGEPLTHAVQQRNIRAACAALAPVAARHRLVVTHGNGPQIGLLALEDEAAGHFPLDVLGAETEGMIGYLLEQELRNRLPGRETATLLTQVVVAADDPAFERPSKPVGPVYTEAEAERVRTEHGWTVARDGAGYRRVVPSPQPLDVISLDTIELLLHSGRLVICGGGGGIPVITRPDGTSSGVEAVIDKDLLAALLAIRLRADLLLILTDVDGVVRGYGSPGATPIAEISTAKLRRLDFEAGSMGPKVEAACRFVEHTGARAAIGSLSDAEALVVGSRGTQVRPPRSSAFTPGRVRAVSSSSG